MACQSSAAMRETVSTESGSGEVIVSAPLTDDTVKAPSLRMGIDSSNSESHHNPILASNSVGVIRQPATA